MEGGCGVSHGGEVVWGLILISEGGYCSPTGRVVDKDTRREGDIFLLDCLDGSLLLRGLGNGVLMNNGSHRRAEHPCYRIYPGHFLSSS